MWASRAIPVVALLCAGGCRCGSAEPRTLPGRAVATADLGSAVAALLEDGSVVVAPDDARAPVEVLGHVAEAQPQGIAAAGSQVLATSAASWGMHAQAFARRGHAVHELAHTGLLCPRGDTPVVVDRREGRWHVLSYDGATLSETDEGAFDAGDAIEACAGDADGIVVEHRTIVFDAPEHAGLGAIDRRSGAFRALRYPGDLVAWRLSAGSVLALVEGPGATGGHRALVRIDRAGGAPTTLVADLENASGLVAGEDFACVADDGSDLVHHDPTHDRIRRVTLATGETTTLLEGVPARCVAVRGESVVVLREERTLAVLP